MTIEIAELRCPSCGHLMGEEEYRDACDKFNRTVQASSTELIDSTSVALEDCSSKEIGEEQTAKQTSKVDSVGVDSERSHYEYEAQLIQRQDEIIKALEEQISEAEQELFEKDKEITRLENDLEEVCEELFLEVNLR